MKLSDLLETSRRPSIIKVMATTAHLDKAVTRIQQKYGIGQKAATNQDLTTKLTEFQSRLKSNNWSRFPWHMASDTLRSFLTSDLRDEARWSDVAGVLLDTLEITSRKSYCRAALDAYLETFHVTSPALNRLRDILNTKPAEDIPVRRHLIEDLQLFRPATAAKLIGQELARVNRPYDLVKSWGVWSPHSNGLFEDVFAEMLRNTTADRKALNRIPFERTMDWLCPNSSTKAEATRAAGIDALVLPFTDESSSELRDEVERFLVKNFGDPRVNQAQWVGVSSQALEIMNRWMTSKSLKMFFDIISKFEGSHMWEPRRKFWTDIDQRKWISDAWVVLNDSGAGYALDLAEKHEDDTFLSHGKLNFREREKCFFIMKVGGLTIVEGTHNFRVRIFDRGSHHAPHLRQKFYDKDEIHARPVSSRGVEYIHDVHENWVQKSEDYMRRNR